MPHAITVTKAERHEALYLRLAALHRHAEAIAARRPGAPLPEATRILAESLLCDIRCFSGGRGLPAAAPAYDGLAAQLGQALAALEAYELRHTRWDPERKCIVWQVADAPLPVQRLRPEPAVVAAAAAPSAEMEEIKRRLSARIAALKRPDREPPPPARAGPPAR